MEGETFHVCEWRIENFGCWNAQVHGSWIRSPVFVLKYVRQIDMYPSYSGEIAVALYKGKVLPSSGGNMSLIDSDGSLICTKRINNKFQWGWHIDCGLKFEEVAAKIKKKVDRLTVRLCYHQSEEAYVEAVSTRLDFSTVSLKIDPKSFESLESDESKKISLIPYSKKNVFDELLLKAVRNGETMEFVLELLTKTANAVSVESQWSLQSADKAFLRKEDNKYLFCKCEPWKFSNSLMSELMDDGIAILLNLKIVNGDKFEKKLNDPLKTTSILKKAIFDSDENSLSNIDTVTSSKTGDSVTALTNDLMCLYQDQDFTDFELKCEDVTFPVHKVILCARSPVFKTMLSTDMTEAASGQVVVEDLDPSTLSLFLIYLYTGAVEDLQVDRALKLYYAADKYQVPSLKGVCADFLCSNVSVSNVCDILSFADKHKNEELTAVSYDFIVNHYNQVLDLEEWRKFSDEEPKLALKTLTQLAQKKQVGKIQ